MNVRNSSVWLGIGLGLGLAAGLAGSMAVARQVNRVDGVGAGLPTGAYTAVGKFEVGLATETLGVPLPWSMPLRDVSEVTLLADWAILHRTEGASQATIVLPRERVIYLNLVE